MADIVAAVAPALLEGFLTHTGRWLPSLVGLKRTCSPRPCLVSLSGYWWSCSVSRCSRC